MDCETQGKRGGVGCETQGKRGGVGCETQRRRGGVDCETQGKRGGVGCETQGRRDVVLKIPHLRASTRRPHQDSTRLLPACVFFHTLRHSVRSTVQQGPAALPQWPVHLHRCTHPSAFSPYREQRTTSPSKHSPRSPETRDSREEKWEVGWE